MNDFDFRFGGIQRLYSAAGLERLRKSHICVVGIGGVGSWVVEALARSGVGELTLVDMDEVCVSNVNRQLHAMDGAIGRPKVDVMAERVKAINPECKPHAVAEFFLPSTDEEILKTKFDYVVDAIDHVANKCLLIAQCRQKRLPIVTVGGAGGRRNPGAVQMTDLALTSHDALLQMVRKRLRDEYGFPKELKQPFGVPCVFSTEPQVFLKKDDKACTRRESGTDLQLSHDTAYGTASFVTGTFGFMMAAHVVSTIAEQGTGTAV